VYVGPSGDMHVYMGVLKDKCVHIEKCAYMGHTIDHTLPILYAIVFLLVGHHSRISSSSLLPHFVVEYKALCVSIVCHIQNKYGPCC
jgi:hypothetical protein